MKTTEKRPVGRPNGKPYKAFNFHCDADLYDKLQQIKGEKPLTRVVNDILRKWFELSKTI